MQDPAINSNMSSSPTDNLLTNKNFEKQLSIICATKEFKKRLLNMAIPRKVGVVTGKDLQKARWHAQKWWSQWLFDNIAKNNLDDFKILRFENDLVSEAEIVEILSDIELDTTKLKESDSISFNSPRNFEVSVPLDNLNLQDSESCRFKLSLESSEFPESSESDRFKSQGDSESNSTSSSLSPPRSDCDSQADLGDSPSKKLIKFSSNTELFSKNKLSESDRFKSQGDSEDPNSIRNFEPRRRSLNIYEENQNAKPEGIKDDKKKDIKSPSGSPPGLTLISRFNSESGRFKLPWSSEESPRQYSRHSGSSFHSFPFSSGVNLGVNSGVNSPRRLKIKNLKYIRLYDYGGVKAEISYALDNMLRKRYSGPPELLDETVFLLGMRYQIIGIDNHYLSIPPNVAKLFLFQLFGSPFNTIEYPYFSAFPKAENVVGSRGTYFSSPFPAEYDTFIFNPPYDETVIDMAVNRLLQQMWLRPMTILCVLPVWDAESQRKINAPMTDKNGNPTTNFEEARKFVPVGKLLHCPYIKEHSILKKDIDNPVFYDFVNNNKFAPCNTHVILLSNGPAKISMKEILAGWN